MTIWIVLGAMTFLVGGYIVWPLLQPSKPLNKDGKDSETPATDQDELDLDLAVYRDQLIEIDRDIDRGVLTDEQAKAARIEVQRRILGADQRIRTQPRTQDMARHTSALRLGAAAITILLIVAGFGFYLDVGAPGMPDRPIASRADEINAMRQAQALQGNRADALNRAVRDLSQKLIENPEDLKGWELLGASLLALGRPEEAQTAFLQAVKLSGRSGRHLAMYAESIIRAENGQINIIARGVLDEADQTDSTDPRIDYYLGLADAQNGNMNAAIDRWIALANSAPAGAGWLPMVVGRIHEVAQTQGIDIAGRLDLPSPPMAGNGPSEEQMRAAAEMTPEERQEMITGMVNSLAQRLEENPDDADGWARLIRAYAVMGNDDAARKAYDTASRRFAEQPQLIARFDALANEVGLSRN